MAITLVVNPGSTSKKYALYSEGADIFSMRFEETGEGFGVCRARGTEQQKCEQIEATAYKDALEIFITSAVEAGVIALARDITAVGVRVVAPGPAFQAHQRMTDAYMVTLEAQRTIAPVHIKATAAELYAVKALLAHVPVYAISDSAFHTSIPQHRRTLGIPDRDAAECAIARFGYHGLSVASISRRTEQFFGVAPDRVVVVHVGGGISATALHYQESVDTSMGYSPASGIMMGSRVGALDADALIGLMAKKGMRSIDVLTNYINRECGFKARTGNADLRLVLKQFSDGDEAAAAALETFRYQLHRQIGGHIALLGGIDAFVFTGTAVVRNPFLRSYILEGLSTFGLTLDSDRNDGLIGREGMVHSDRSDVSIAVMQNDEMGEIARMVATLTSDEEL